jgi:hypothetical protein
MLATSNVEPEEKDKSPNVLDLATLAIDDVWYSPPTRSVPSKVRVSAVSRATISVSCKPNAPRPPLIERSLRLWPAGCTNEAVRSPSEDGTVQIDNWRLLRLTNLSACHRHGGGGIDVTRRLGDGRQCTTADVAELGDGQVVVEVNNTGATEIEVKRLPSQTERPLLRAGLDLTTEHVHNTCRGNRCPGLEGDLTVLRVEHERGGSIGKLKSATINGRGRSAQGKHGT